MSSKRAQWGIEKKAKWYEGLVHETLETETKAIKVHQRQITHAQGSVCVAAKKESQGQAQGRGEYGNVHAVFGSFVRGKIHTRKKRNNLTGGALNRTHMCAGTDLPTWMDRCAEVRFN